MNVGAYTNKEFELRSADGNSISYMRQDDTTDGIIFTVPTGKRVESNGDIVAYGDGSSPGGSWWDDLPIASAVQLGGVKIGSGISVAGDGTISVSAAAAFDDLTDTPATKVASKLVAVNSGGTALEYVDFPVSAVWGNITGTLSNQTDLQNELDGKADDSDLNNYVLKAGDTMSGKLAISVNTPTDYISHLTQANTSGYGLRVDTANTGSSSAFYLHNTTNAQQLFKIQGDGKVAIGSGTSAYKFQMFEEAGGRARFEFNSSAHTISLVDYIAGPAVYSNKTGIYISGKDALWMSEKYDQYWVTRTDAGTYTERMRLDHETGNLGIATTSPDYKLDVNGSMQLANGHYYRIKNASGTSCRLAGMTSGNGIYMGGVDTAHTGNVYLRAGGSDKLIIEQDGTTTLKGNTYVQNGSSGYVGSYENSNEYTRVLPYGLTGYRSAIYLRNSKIDGDVFLDTTNTEGTTVRRIGLKGEDDNVRFYNHNGAEKFSIRPTTGTYGSLEIDGGATGGWEGFSIGGRAVFMHNNSTSFGLFDDVNSHWALFATMGGSVQLRYAGTTKIETAGTGAEITGTLTSTGDVIAYAT